MKNIYFNVGPSQLYPTVKDHIIDALENNIPSLSHRSRKFMDIFQDTTLSLRKLMRILDSHHIFFLSSSLESMERIIQNCVQKYSFHFVNGAFSKKFHDISIELNKCPQKFEVPYGYGFDFDRISIPKKTELICITQNETSTGVSVPVQWINRLQKDQPDKLIAVDIVSSAPIVNLDYKKIDIAFFSVQKAFGLPSGLGVLIVSDRAIAKTKFLLLQNISVGSYHNFLSLKDYSLKFQTPETPNVLDIYLLGKVCHDLLKMGLETLRSDTDIKAKLLYDFFDNHAVFHPFVKDDSWRSSTTIVIDVAGQTNTITDKLKSNGLIVGSGYGPYKNSHIRIANFPAHSITDIKRLISNLT